MRAWLWVGATRLKSIKMTRLCYQVQSVLPGLESATSYECATRLKDYYQVKTKKQVPDGCATRFKVCY